LTQTAKEYLVRKTDLLLTKMVSLHSTQIHSIWKVAARISENKLSSNIFDQLWIWIALSVFLAIGSLISFWKLAFTIVSCSQARKEL